MNGCNITAGQQDYAERLNQIESQKEDYYRELGIAPGIPTMKGSYGDPENTGVGYNTIIRNLGDHSVPAEWAEYVKKNEQKDAAPGAPIAWEKASQPEEVQPGYGYVADNNESEETFYYHSDHLGSTSYVTDDSARVTQYTAYLPYGELLVDEHSSSEDMPYKFNGKELDEETGLYYYGARYMQPVASIWYGVDPLTEKYTNVSAYTYCLGNPVKLVDVDGKDYDVYYNGSSITISATYLTDDASAESAQQAVSLWNDLSDRFSMDGLPVKFDFSISVVPADEFPEDIDHEKILTGKANIMTSVNTYILNDIKDPNINGETKGGRLITVDNEQAVSLTGAHEIGHTVGLQHSYSGLMTAASSDPYRSKGISKNEVKTIIKRAIKGKPLKDADGTAAGTGNFHNNTENSINNFKYKMEDLNK